MIQHLSILINCLLKLKKFQENWLVAQGMVASN